MYQFLEFFRNFSIRILKGNFVSCSPQHNLTLVEGIYFKLIA